MTRVPQKRTLRSMRATQPSTPPSNVRTTGPQGTTGGRAAPVMGRGARRSKRGMRPGKITIGQEKYLWILVLIEVALIGGFRKYFRRYHGG